MMFSTESNTTLTMMRARHVLVVSFCLLAGAIGAQAGGGDPTELDQAVNPVPEELLLDVGILIFDPGLKEHEDVEPEVLEKQGIFPYLRRSEARYYPYQLKDTLESSGHWGAVRVVPDAEAAVDLLISGEIVKSTGLQLALRIRAEDSTGRIWVKDRKYKIEADARAYREDDAANGEVVTVEDPYQFLFNQIANDLITARRKLDPKKITNIRTVTALLFATDLAPDAFNGYLATNTKGRVSVAKLPARDDPMLNRVARIRESDYEFIDTLNEFYSDFVTEMDEPYGEWRKYSHEEQLALRKIKRAARTRKILGALLLVGGAVAGAGDASGVEEAAAEAAQVAGGLMVVSGVMKGQEVKTHKETLRELAGSLDAEVEPMLQDVEGQTLKLSGTAEAQYVEFRNMLREIFAAETGLPLDADSAASLDSDP
jgi:hypothetical protein